MSLSILAILSTLPIITALTLLIFFKLPASLCMPPAYLIALLLSLIFWQLPYSFALAATLNGLLTALSILIIVFGALLLLNTLKVSGSIATIGAGIFSLTPDRRIQAILLAFGFATLIEGASGFGTAGALTAPLLVGIGFPPLAAAIITLLGHIPAVSFGAVGTPILGGVAVVLDTPEVHQDLPKPFIQWITQDVTIWNANFHSLGTLLIPFILILYLTAFFGEKGEERRGLEVYPLALLAGLSFALAQNLMARFTGPELPSMVGGSVVILITGFLVMKRVFLPAKSWDFPPQKRWPSEWQGTVERDFPQVKMAPFKAWIPYLSIFLLLLITRIEIFHLKEIFSTPSLTIENLFSTDLTFQWRWLYNPGVFPFIPVTISAWFFYHLPKREILSLTTATIKQILPATIAMTSAIAMAQIMMHSGNNPQNLEGMLPSLSIASAHLFSQGFPLISPWIGVLGSFISGSNTISNILLAGYQYQVAESLEISRTIMIALHSTGAAVGNSITIHNVVAVLTVVGALGREGQVIEKNLFPLFLYLLVVGISAFISFTLYPQLF